MKIEEIKAAWRGEGGWEPTGAEAAFAGEAEFLRATRPMGAAEAFGRDGERLLVWDRVGGGAALSRRAGRFLALAWEDEKKEPYFSSEGPDEMLSEDEGLSLRLAWEEFLSAEREEEARRARDSAPERPAWESW